MANRPETSQIVIDEFTKIIDSQDTKGIKKYQETIDAAKDEKYNWELMALEETADLQKYLVKRIKELEKTSISNLCSEAHKIAISKGWYEQPKETGTLLALVHSEVSEALEADRKDDKEHFAEELADVCIRIFDLCGYKGINLEQAIIKKMAYNKTRPQKHGGKLY